MTLLRTILLLWLMAASLQRQVLYPTLEPSRKRPAICDIETAQVAERCITSPCELRLGLSKGQRERETSSCDQRRVDTRSVSEREELARCPRIDATLEYRNELSIFELSCGS